MKEKIYYNRHIFYFILACIVVAFLFDLFRNDNSPIFYRIMGSTFLLYIFGYFSKELLEKFEKRHEREKEQKEMKKVIDKYFKEDK
jgi:putative effector of murein hydrolase LrgA (UPF0299 family)